MHQQQWLVVIEEMGGSASPPIPNSFNQARTTPAGRWTQGLTLDGKGPGLYRGWARRPAHGNGVCVEAR
jgi:hypothetical protein